MNTWAEPGRKHTSNHRPMRNGKREVLRKTSASARTWDMTRQLIPTPVMQRKSWERLLWENKSKSGYQSKVTIYECEDCSGCPYKEKCTKSKGNKKLYLSKNFLEKASGVLWKHPERKRDPVPDEPLDSGRSGAFGVLKNDYQFQRFLLRGKPRVRLEILLLCLGYNLNKLHAKIQNERTGKHLFLIKSA